MSRSRRLVVLHDLSSDVSLVSEIVELFADWEQRETILAAGDVADDVVGAKAVVLAFSTIQATLSYASQICRPVVAIVDAWDEQKAREAGIGVIVARRDLTPALLKQAVTFAIERFRLIEETEDARDEIDRIKHDYPLLPRNAPEIIARFDLDLRHVYVNLAVSKATGVPAEHFIGKTDRELGMPEELCLFWEEKLLEAIATNSEVRYEFEYPSPDGKLYYQARLAPEHNSEGEIVSVLSIATDITERKKFEDQLDRSEKLFRSTFDNAAVGIAHVDLEGRWLRVNDRLCEIVGYNREELLTRTFQQVTHPEDLAPDLALAARLIAREIPHYSLEKRYIRKNGDVVWAMLTVSLLLNENDDPASFVSIVQDITDRKKTEEALRQSEKNRDLALQAGKMGVWEWDLALGKVQWSRTLEEIYGFSPGEFPGTAEAFFALVHPDDLSILNEAIAEAFRNGPHYQVEFRARQKNGSYRWMAGQGQVLYDATGAPTGLSGVSWDVTEARVAQEELKVADRRKNEFLAMLAHELRNPLAAIRNASELLRIHATDDPDVRWGHEVIGRQTTHLKRLINDLLDVSRITQGKIPLQRSEIDLRDVMKRSVEDVQATVSTKNQHLEVNVPDTPLRLRGDSQRLEQVISNLLTNASKYTDKGGMIRAEASLDGNEIVVRIRDNGIGISPEMLATIFGLFIQADNSLDRAQGGLGIGLTLVKMLTEQHGGTVSAASEGLGRGSEFQIRLPALDAAPRTQKSAEPRQPFAKREGEASSRRILLVDDNEDAARGLARLLRLSGHQVDVAHDGYAALQAAKMTRPDVFLLDIGLPGMNGYDLARELRQSPDWSRSMFIAVSGYGQGKDFQRSTDAGFHHYLVKPIDFDLLTSLITANHLG